LDGTNPAARTAND
jgi:hypothetical protein